MEPLKKCWICKELKSKTSFYSLKMSRCIECDKRITKEKRAGGLLKGKDRRDTCKRYGITVETYDRILREQNNACAICRRTSEKSLCIDHIKGTNVIRGLLCSNCNTALGLLDENFDYFDAAKEYLREKGRAIDYKDKEKE